MFMKMINSKFLAVLGIVCLFQLSGCSGPKPVLYPNDVLNDVGKEQAQQDIVACEELAEEYVETSGKGEQVAGKTVAGGAVGAATGAVGGAITGNVGLGSAVGAATGATYGFLRGLFTSDEPNPTYKRFVDRCLKEKGYEPIGWD